MIEVLLAGPVFVEQEMGGIVHGLMEVVIDATRLFARAGNEREQSCRNAASLPGLALMVATTVSVFTWLLQFKDFRIASAAARGFGAA